MRKTGKTYEILKRNIPDQETWRDCTLPAPVASTNRGRNDSGVLMISAFFFLSFFFEERSRGRVSIFFRSLRSIERNQFLFELIGRMNVLGKVTKNSVFAEIKCFKAIARWTKILKTWKGRKKIFIFFSKMHIQIYKWKQYAILGTIQYVTWRYDIWYKKRYETPHNIYMPYIYIYIW